jgi:hypothetical protein
MIIITITFFAWRSSGQREQNGNHDFCTTQIALGLDLLGKRHSLLLLHNEQKLSRVYAQIISDNLLHFICSLRKMKIHSRLKFNQKLLNPFPSFLFQISPRRNDTTSQVGSDSNTSDSYSGSTRLIMARRLYILAEDFHGFTQSF